MSTYRTIIPEGISAFDPAYRAWKLARDKADAEFAEAMGWKIVVGLTDTRFEPQYVRPESNVVYLPRYPRAHAALHPTPNPGPGAAA